MGDNDSVPGDWIKRAALALAGGAVLLSFFVAPDLSRGHDEMLYLTAAENFATQGFDYAYTREPLYPLLLAVLKVSGLDPVAAIPPLQTAAFLGSLYFFLRALLGEKQTRAESLLLSACITLIPTFLVPLNGSIYTESLSASLIFLMLGGCAYIHRNALRPLAAAGSYALVFACSMSLGLIKGTFDYIHFAFAGLGIAWLLGSHWMARRAAGGKLNTEARKVPLCAMAIAFLLVAAGSRAGSEGWLQIQQRRSAEKLAVYSRGGTVLYGRTEYARNFDFSRQSVPFLVCAVSISAYRKLYSDDGYQYTFDAENAIGYRKQEEGVPDAQLFKAGLENIAAQPLRQAVFSLYELARFPIHHTNAGFARFTLPGLGPMFHSGAVAVLLKIFNLALLLMVPVFLWRRRALVSWLDLRAGGSAEASGTAIYLLYALAYLAAYSFASTIVRMVYPIAPLLVVMSWQIWRKGLGGTTQQTGMPVPPM